MGFINQTKNKTALQNDYQPQKTDTFDWIKTLKLFLHLIYHKKNKKIGRDWKISAADNKRLISKTYYKLLQIKGSQTKQFF